MKYEQIVKGERLELPIPKKWGNERVVAKTKIVVDDGEPVEVSTVRLMFALPISWESMVFADRFPDLDQDNMVERYRSEEDAIAGHETMVSDVLEYLGRIS